MLKVYTRLQEIIMLKYIINDQNMMCNRPTSLFSIAARFTTLLSFMKNKLFVCSFYSFPLSYRSIIKGYKIYHIYCFVLNLYTNDIITYVCCIAWVKKVGAYIMLVLSYTQVLHLSFVQPTYFEDFSLSQYKLFHSPCTAKCCILTLSIYCNLF